MEQGAGAGHSKCSSLYYINLLYYIILYYIILYYTMSRKKGRHRNRPRRLVARVPAVAPHVARVPRSRGRARRGRRSRGGGRGRREGLLWGRHPRRGGGCVAAVAAQDGRGEKGARGKGHGGIRIRNSILGRRARTAKVRGAMRSVPWLCVHLLLSLTRSLSLSPSFPSLSRASRRTAAGSGGAPPDPRAKTADLNGVRRIFAGTCTRSSVAQ